MRHTFAVLSFLAVCSLAGCGGGGGGDTGPLPPTLNVAGNWELMSTSQVITGSQIELVAYLNNSGNNVTAHVRTVSDCFTIDDLLSFTGAVNNGQITRTSAPVVGQTVTIQGTLSNSAVNGTYSISGGCADGDHGTISGFKVRSFSGTWSGNFVSSSSTTAQVSTTVTQGGEEPAFLGVSRVTGDVTFSNSACFTSGTIPASAGFAFGVNFAAFVNTNDGGTVQFVGFSNDSGTQITGDYTVTGGTCDGDFGTGTLTRQ